MVFVLERVSGPAVEPITLAEAKQQCRVTDITTGSPPVASHPDDDQISGLIVAAREWAEEFTGRALIEQSWRLTIYCNPCLGHPNNVSGIYQWGRYGEIMLHKSPVIEITSFVSVDSAGVETEFGEGSPFLANYELREGNSKFPRIVGLDGATWCTDILKIEFRAGFAPEEGSPLAPDAARVMERFKIAIRLWVEAHYDRDKEMMPILVQAAENMIRPERVELGMA